MAVNTTPKEVRLYIGIGFAIVLIFCAILSTMAVVSGLRAEEPWFHLPNDTSPAVRLLLFVIGLAISWFIGRMLYKRLIRAEVPVGDSTNIAYLALFFILLISASLFFLGVFYWYIFPFLFFILLIFSILALLELLGALFTFGSVLLAFLAVFVTWYLLS